MLKESEKKFASETSYPPGWGFSWACQPRTDTLSLVLPILDDEPEIARAYG